MPVVYMNEKEAKALVILLEERHLQYPQNESLLSEYTAKLPDRVRLCLQKQGKKKTAQQDAKR